VACCRQRADVGVRVGVSECCWTPRGADSAQSKIISTRIRVARNLSMFPLNPGGDPRPPVPPTPPARPPFKRWLPLGGSHGWGAPG
jgi:hypothetical protein